MFARFAKLHVNDHQRTYQSMFAKFAKLHVAAHLHDYPRYHLAESDRVTSPTHINREPLERSECNRERVVVAHCPVRIALRSFGRITFFKRALTTTAAARSFTMCRICRTADHQHVYPTGHTDDDGNAHS